MLKASQISISQKFVKKTKDHQNLDKARKTDPRMCEQTILQ